MMIKPNWDIFKAKFNDNPEYSFEYLCYLLFCLEFDKPQGIFRYKNQAGIEWNPIEVDGKTIVAQCKFYTNKMRTYEKDLLKMLEVIKSKYPTPCELKFYTNQDWGQGKKQDDSQAKIEIEKKAHEYGINIDWRTNEAYFLSPNVALNQDIAKHFFSDESIFDLIYDKQQHTERVLSSINTEIKFGLQAIELDRTKEINELENNISKNQVLILTGVGGVGKTAIIKKLYKQEKEKDEAPFYLFKASEFALSIIDNLFGKYSLQKFIEIHKQFKRKIMVIDSAEKLLDIDNPNPFNEFLSALIQNEWKILFTTRNHYLDVLQYRFNDLGIKIPNIMLENLTKKELSLLAEQYSFTLSEEKLNNLIVNPFYLNEYLRFYVANEGLSYQDFKKKLWNQNISKSNPTREMCFLDLSYQRAKQGQFFIDNDKLNNDSLKQLVQDGILGYEEAGYFIAHDIYEEWALEKIIEKYFIKRESNLDFFQSIGSSLPIRRSFRSWVSEKLLLDNEDIKTFIEQMIDDNEIESFWKDEVFVSILLSDYSDTFFDNFEKELLANDFELLKRVSFLLRLACKEADTSFFDKIKMKKDIDPIDIMSIFNKPRGNGWNSFIKYICSYMDTLKPQDINWVLPVLVESMNKLQDERTGKEAALIALSFYQMIIEDKYFNNNEQIKKLCTLVVNGSVYVAEDLKSILNQVLENRWKYHSDKYFDLSKLILSGLWGIQVSNVMPKEVMKLANLLWRYTPKELIESPFGIRDDDSFHNGLERAYGIEKYGLDYSTASAYQTPIYNLLKVDFKSTIDFILQFVNESIEIYSKSKYTEYLLKVKVNINEECIVEQYHDMNLWGMYREINSSPILLQSIHMALEKYLLEIAKDLDNDTLEKILIYLLQSSVSSSISAIVASIVLAYPDKTFDIAKILLKTKEFIIYDFSRYQSNHMGMNSIDFGFPKSVENSIFDDERKQTAKDEHRFKSLENLCLFYQFFRSDGVSEKDTDKRQSELWKILDNYYKELDNTDDKTWEMSLARMDRRKMDIQFEQQEKGYAISFNPELSDELKEYSEKAQEEYQEKNQYLSLNLWARYKLDNNDKYKQYKEYEKTPKLVFSHLKEVVQELEDKKNILYENIPIDVSLILLKEYQDNLSHDEKVFCKDMLFDVVTKSSHTYKSEPIIAFLPQLMKIFPAEKNNIKDLLFKLLCLKYNLCNLWADFNDDANSLLIGYLLLKPKYLLDWKQKRDEFFKSNRYANFDSKKFDMNFMEENKETLDKVLNNTLKIDDIDDYSKMDDEVLIQAFNFLPDKVLDTDHKVVAQNIIYNITLRLLKDKKEIDFSDRNKFIKKFAIILLLSSKENIDNYLNVLSENFNDSEVISEFFIELIRFEDKAQEYDKFWYIWKFFEEDIIKTCKNGEKYYTNKIIKAYLFNGLRWNKDAKDWHTLKEKDKRFFKQMSEKIGHCPTTLYSISELLITIGSSYLDDGIGWISCIIKNNKNLLIDDLALDTVFNIENLTRKYILKNSQKIKKEKIKKQEVLEILNFLVEKGSAIGYMLRESVL